ncbi:sugar MFS transporter [Edaphobacter modestus]|uniref:FHS family L-fucose permease-like MFS transporter n=1 Tax=Edaphobacter modestus TaxID=388466 RepID=A0A4Q7Z0Q1_9BACT|nr:sugar MFS transporter [Edaphobacter modestus]RZU43181.1 FHS family L-fucose permease-like MFS transporter [Edaphobacter modestus]
MAIGVGTTAATTQYSGARKTDIRAMSIATMLFFMWGFLTCLNDILIPHLKGIFDLNYGQAMLVQFCFFSSYFIFALPAGKLVEWRGYKGTMVIGLLVMAAGAFLFLPASTAASFALFLSALVILAAGITSLQVAANPYVANLGPPETSAARLNLAQAFNSFGTFVAPFFGGALILSSTQATQERLQSFSAAALQQYRMEQASSVRLPYMGIGLTLVLLAISFAVLKMPTMDFTRDIRPGELDADTTGDSIWKHPVLLAGALGIFVYVGAEVSIGSFLVNYFGLPDIAAFSERTAAKYVSLYWGGAMIGRFIGSWLLTKLKTSTVLGTAAVVAFGLVVMSILTHGHTAMWAILAVGLFNSVMFPSIFTVGLSGLGPLTSKGSSLMVAAIVGGALIPLAEGHLADKIGVQHAFVIPAVCYIYIALFGYLGGRRAEREVGLA